MIPPMDGSEPRRAERPDRPRFPARAVVTAGMPYGNKDLHFGHIGGVFVHADAYARFLRDRIGSDDVVFVSGTDCYGSPIVESHRKAREAGEFDGSLEDFARHFHAEQRATLDAYHVALDAFATSALDPFVETHRALGAEILRSLHAAGELELRSTEQFYDAKANQFLTGRQVLGHCPIPGCKSEKAYAEECDLGHQFEPRDLIAPKSSVTGDVPERRRVANWYLPLETRRDELKAWFEDEAEGRGWRPFSVQNLLEYFEPPSVYLKKDDVGVLTELASELPDHTLEEGTAHSDRIVLKTFAEVERVTEALAERGIGYRSSKTLAPLRLTGNLEWGLSAPDLDGVEGLTFWVWPESLWAPISFSRTALEQKGARTERWKDFWCSSDAEVYQFIGEDNVFYYGLAQMALWMALTRAPGFDGDLRITSVIANKHLLFLDKKASSSGAVKPPMARELLEFYSAEELRMHFLSLALGKGNARFSPKPLDPSNETGADPVAKDGDVVTKQLNRHARSCFYAAQKHYDGRLPDAPIADEVVLRAEEALLDFEAAMHRTELHRAAEVAADLLRFVTKRWNRTNPFRDDCDPEKRAPALAEGFHGLRVALLLFHPLAPAGTEAVRRTLRVGEELWSWSRAFEPLSEFLDGPEHAFEHVPPRHDFFDLPEGRDDR